MSRRDAIRMSDEEIRAFLAGSRTIILTSNGRDGFPHPMPMWFALDDDGSIRMTTFRKSQKVLNLRRDPRVSLLVEDGEEYAQLRGVVIYSQAEVIDDKEVVLDTLMRASAGADPNSFDEATRKSMREGMLRTAEKRVVIRCKPDRIVSWDHRKLGGTY